MTTNKAINIQDEINALKLKAVEISKRNWTSGYPDFKKDRLEITQEVLSHFQGKVDPRNMAHMVSHIIMNVPFGIAQSESADKALIYMGASHLVLSINDGAATLDELKDITSNMANNFIALRLTIENQDFVKKVSMNVFDKSVMITMFDMVEDSRGILVKRSPELQV
jgi:hypothetical protein